MPACWVLQRHVGTQIKDSEEETPCPGLLQSCLRRSSAPMPWCETHEDESILEHVFNWGVLLLWGMRHVIGDRGIVFWDCTGLRIFREGQEREESRWFGKEWVWENGGARRLKIQSGYHGRETTSMVYYTICIWCLPYHLIMHVCVCVQFKSLLVDLQIALKKNKKSLYQPSKQLLLIIKTWNKYRP